MLGRWGSAVLRYHRGPLKPCLSLYARSYSQDSSSAEAKKKRRQRTLNVEDLPLRAVNADGEPVAALPDLIKSHVGSNVSSPKGKGKGKDSTATEKGVWSSPSEDDVTITAPRLNELGPDGQSWPPLAKDVLVNLARFPECILLTRVGGFYESYYDQAPSLASMLGIKLANRTWGGRNVPMAGFPIVQLEKYLKVLVIDHRRLVAICDEFKEIEEAPIDLKQASSSTIRLNEKVDIKRRVTRVVSPGTLIDEHFLDPFSSNWVLSISKRAEKYGLAWLDVSTADFFTTTCNDERSLRDEVARIGPSEVVLEKGAFHVRVDDVSKQESGDWVESEGHPLWEVLDPAKIHISLCVAEDINSLASTELDAAEDAAVANLTAHLRSRLLEQNIQNVEDLTGEALGPLNRRREQVMLIDANTLMALEINASLRRQETTYNTSGVNPSVRGSLLSNIRRTVTKGGSRLLAQWLSAPSTALPVIHRRQALVALFHRHLFLMEDVRHVLRKGAGDVNRALQRIITSRNDVQDLLEVRDFTKLCHELVHLLEKEMTILLKLGEGNDDQDGWVALKTLVETFTPLVHLSQRLGEAIDEMVIIRRLQLQEDRERDVEMQVLNEGALQASGQKQRKHSDSQRKINEQSSDDEALWGAPFEHLIRPTASPHLEALTKEHKLLRRRARKLELDLREKYGDRVSLKHLLGQGFVVHLSDYRESAKGLATIESEMNLAYKSKTTRTYYHEAFTKIGSRLVRVERELDEKETVELQRLRLSVLLELGKLRKNSSLVNELDCLLGFAKLAEEMSFCRPTVDEGEEIDIVGGRHLSVEMALLDRDMLLTSTPNRRPARAFTPNDIHLDPSSRLHLITGPNMGGKSTLLRMTAIITILAQLGSFVPAVSCRIGVVDQIFSRIGAHDSINTEKSTFMVEMLEVSEFLQRSTRRSLIICDEIGRGTDHKTGIAIAYATALHLLHEVQCKCLFATHLYKVGDLLMDQPGVSFLCTDLQESASGDVVFSHKLRPGLNRNSHGLAIARLAGVPEDVLQVARNTLHELQGHDE